MFDNIYNPTVKETGNILPIYNPIIGETSVGLVAHVLDSDLEDPWSVKVVAIDYKTVNDKPMIRVLAHGKSSNPHAQEYSSLENNLGILNIVPMLTMFGTKYFPNGSSNIFGVEYSQDAVDTYQHYFQQLQDAKLVH